MDKCGIKERNFVNLFIVLALFLALLCAIMGVNYPAIQFLFIPLFLQITFAVAVNFRLNWGSWSFRPMRMPEEVFMDICFGLKEY